MTASTDGDVVHGRPQVGAAAAVAARFVLLLERPLTSEYALLNPSPAPGILDREPELLSHLRDRRDMARSENPAR